MNFITYEVNDLSYQTNKFNQTILQSCIDIGLEIPKFCYHEKLSIAGNCRMCLVEIANPKTVKPVASCALNLTNKMIIYTNTMLVKKAREGILEFLLCNHPLDCPICDQGGECDLQDQSIIFGNDRGRFYENKRSVSDKECGPLIKTIMTRCIHCSRCIRFLTEIDGFYGLGMVGRGSNMEIGSYIEKTINTPLSGNIIDLCPVGALTSKPYSFIARPWELRSIESIDIMDSICSRIRIDIRNSDIMRILPSYNENLNEDWITDKTRFFFDGLKRQRLQIPLFKQNDILISKSWEECFEIIKFKFYYYKKNIIAIVGKLVDLESVICLKDFLNNAGSDNYSFQDNFFFMNSDFKKYFLINTNFVNLENFDLYVLINFNPRLELPLFNLKIRKSFIQNHSSIVVFGFIFNLTYQFLQFSNNNISFLEFLKGKQTVLCKKFIHSKSPIFLLGSQSMKKKNIFMFNFFSDFCKYKLKKENINYINTILLFTGYISSLYIGLNKKNIRTKLFSKNKILYLLSVDYFDISFLKKNDFIIYQGHTGDHLLKLADVLLPGCSQFEKNASYLNLEGKIQKSKYIFNPPINGRTDWKIINALNFFILGFDSQSYQNKIITLKKLKNRILQVVPPLQENINFLNLEIKNKIDILLFSNFPYYNEEFNFYQSDIISKNSKTLSLVLKRVFNIEQFYKEI
jgi:NADH-quinone oxidoreductase chain G